MPSALSASRDAVAQALARVRSGIQKYSDDLNRPGLEIKVEPFDAHNVSTAAGMVKLGTSIAAAQRAKANLQEKQKDVELTREKTRAEIAKIRADEKYMLGEGRQTGSGPQRLETAIGDIPAGTPVPEANVILADRRLKESQRAASERDTRTGRVTAAQAALTQIDKRAERDIQDRATLQFGTWKDWFQAAQDPKGFPLHHEEALVRLGIDPKVFDLPPEHLHAIPPAQKQKMIDDAKQRIFQGLVRKNTIAVQKYFQPRRERYQSIIDQGSQGFQSMESGGQGDDEVIDLIVDENGNLVPAPQ
jgi:hypothetical protein